jgi:hypothetical protein
LALARDLIARRDTIDAELAALFSGAAPAPKTRRRRQLSDGSDAETPERASQASASSS